MAFLPPCLSVFTSPRSNADSKTWTSVMKLPAHSTQPLIMAGLGTGLAPFRAFVQHRAWEKQQGKEIGSVLLYMGSRHQREEYCYGEEWEAYQDAGIITLLGRAFSRDQPQKICTLYFLLSSYPIRSTDRAPRHVSGGVLAPDWFQVG